MRAKNYRTALGCCRGWKLLRVLLLCLVLSGCAQGLVRSEATLSRLQTIVEATSLVGVAGKTSGVEAGRSPESAIEALNGETSTGDTGGAGRNPGQSKLELQSDGSHPTVLGQRALLLEEPGLEIGENKDESSIFVGRKLADSPSAAEDLEQSNGNQGDRLAGGAPALGDTGAVQKLDEHERQLLADASPPKKRFAYVTIHYEGTSRDREYVLGILVMVRSLQLTMGREWAGWPNLSYPHSAQRLAMDPADLPGAKKKEPEGWRKVEEEPRKDKLPDLSSWEVDIVVLVSDSVSAASRALFASMGCRVQNVTDVQNPFKGETLSNPNFEFTLNKLYVWQLVEYDRVVFLDADNIALHPMHELFLCGEFCAVEMNPCHFHTGLMVVKPNLQAFNRLIDALGQLKSYDGADQGFLTEYFQRDITNGPLFVGDPVSSGGLNESSLPAAMRLPIGYNMNHKFFYELYSWDLFRVHHFGDLRIPALSLGFPMASVLKPWYWWAPLLMDLHWEWQEIRRTLENPSDNYFSVLSSSARCLVLLLFLGVLAGVGAVVRTKSRRARRAADLAVYFLRPNSWMETLVHLTIVVYAAYWAASLIDKLIPARIGLFLFVLLHQMLIVGFYGLFASLQYPCGHVGRMLDGRSRRGRDVRGDLGRRGALSSLLHILSWTISFSVSWSLSFWWRLLGPFFSRSGASSRRVCLLALSMGVESALIVLSWQRVYGNILYKALVLGLAIYVILRVQLSFLCSIRVKSSLKKGESEWEHANGGSKLVGDRKRPMSPDQEAIWAEEVAELSSPTEKGTLLDHSHRLARGRSFHSGGR